MYGIIHSHCMPLSFDGAEEGEFELEEEEEEMPHICSHDLYNNTAYQTGFRCERGFQCVFEEEMMSYTSFDEIWASAFLVFQVMTRQDWSQLMFDLEDSVGNILPYLYIPSIVLLGGFVAIKMFLAVMVDEVTLHTVGKEKTLKIFQHYSAMISKDHALVYHMSEPQFLRLWRDLGMHDDDNIGSEIFSQLDDNADGYLAFEEFEDWWSEEERHVAYKKTVVEVQHIA